MQFIDICKAVMTTFWLEKWTGHVFVSEKTY